MAGELGFEPRLTESESAVLPLNYSPMAAYIADFWPFSSMDISDIWDHTVNTECQKSAHFRNVRTKSGTVFFAAERGARALLR
jgi:hypothetical protein